MEAFAAVDIAQCPFRHGRTLPRQFPIGGDNLVGCAHKYGIVDCLCLGRAEGGHAAHLVEIDNRIVTSVQFGRYFVTSFFQMNDGRGRGR